MTGARSFEYRWSWTLPAPPEALWPLVSDTNRFNRDTGLPPVEDARRASSPGGEPAPVLENARRRLRFSRFGLSVEWEEQPFEWIRPYRFGVVRRYSRGPLREMRIRAELEPVEGERTRLVYGVTARPAGLLGLLAIPLGIGLVSRIVFGRVFRRYARRVARDGAGHEGVDPGPRGGPARGASALEDRLVDGGVAPDVARALAGHLADADDLSVARLRPYALADVWGLDRDEVLEGFLRATRGGVLDLRWDLLCPLCRGPEERASTLSELRTRGVHCDTCRIDFDADMERSVELVFVPNPAVRPVDAPAFCVAGPQITPHVVVQQLLEPGEERVVRPHLETGRYRLRSLDRDRDASFRVADAGGRRARAELGGEGWTLEVESAPDEKARLCADPELVLCNGSGAERLVLVERTTWSDDAVTGAEVTALQEFRDLFSGEVLAAGEFLSVGSMTVLFTDLRDSTRMYRDLGDGPAFGRVMEHFEVLRGAVADEGGAVVKTIGDAVMAVFREPAAGVRAALAAHRALDTASGRSTERDTSTRTDLVLKVGLHHGPCFVVRANDRLDYFGTTVNLAARLEGLARGRDVVVSEGVRRDAGVERLAAEGGMDWEALDPGEEGLPGLEDLEVRPWRLRALD